VQTWTQLEVQRFLGREGLGVYNDVFVQHEVDGRLLKILTAADLAADFPTMKRMHVVKLLGLIADLE
jgi:hypothetical protein